VPDSLNATTCARCPSHERCQGGSEATEHSFADGPEAGLAIVDEFAQLPALEGYHLVPTVRADFL
jgi:hypothetical protein